MPRSLLQFVLRLLRDRAGAMATTAAIWLPIGAILLAGAIDLAAVNATRQQLQDAADAAALDGGRELGLTTVSALSQRTNANVAAQIGSHPELSYNVTTTVSQDGRRVTVAISAVRQSFFGNLLPPGGWNMSASATAEQMSTLPLCVLTTGTSLLDDINLIGQSRITANGCLVHANSDVRANYAALVTAGLVQASGVASGPITPAPQSGAPPINDPFTSLNMAAPGPCVPVPPIPDNTSASLLPGVHCAPITVGQGATLSLLPGEHYFQGGSLSLTQNAILQGDDVVLFFDSTSDFQFMGMSDIRLSGRRTGQFAGFVLAAAQANHRTFNISSTSAHQLLGTVYIPNATLSVSGASRVADQSAWTVIVARSLQISSQADLMINNNYTGTSVPAPRGVGPTAAAVRLAH